MQRDLGIHGPPLLATLAIVATLTFSFVHNSSACTVFVLTDGHRVLFCNNEDWTNPATRIWFVPGGTGYQGCVYVGFDDGWARGGMNSEGLACDWVGGFLEEWHVDSATSVRGNPTERLLESCATVDEAIQFFQNHSEPDFRRARIFVADRSGASVVIGAHEGKLQIDRSERSRGFGYAFQTFRDSFARDSELTAANGASLLHACLQEGTYATKYSNIFDLTSGDIYLHQFHQRVPSAQMNLGVELARGGHYFDMVQIHRQFSNPVMSLLLNMRRFVMDEFPPIHDPDTRLTNHVRALIEDAISGNMQADDYRAEFWSAISPLQMSIREDLRRFGRLQSVALVECRTEPQGRLNRYRIEFDNIRSLMRFEIDDRGKVVSFKSEATERRPGADPGE